jgi:hypothetical protein
MTNDEQIDALADVATAAYENCPSGGHDFVCEVGMNAAVRAVLNALPSVYASEDASDP